MYKIYVKYRPLGPPIGSRPSYRSLGPSASLSAHRPIGLPIGPSAHRHPYRPLGPSASLSAPRHPARDQPAVPHKFHNNL